MASPEYKKVFSNLQNITDALSANKTAADGLCLKLQMESWIDPVEDPSPEDLMNVVLNRIKKDASQFHVFKRLLYDIPGLDVISRQLEAVNTIRSKLRNYVKWISEGKSCYRVSNVF